MCAFKKRTESNLVTALGNYLQTLENLGKIACWSRQQAGNICIPGKNKFYKLRLGREGISDLWVIPMTYQCGVEHIGKPFPMIWIEAKLDGEEQSPAQIRFQKLVETVGHFYWLIHDCDELDKKLKEIGVL